MRESRIEDTSYRDLITIALLGFVMISILLLLFLNPPTIDDTPATDTGLRIEIAWPDNIDADVDLWVKAPNDVPIGYSNLGSIVANLVRDDLGNYSDPGYSNHETVITRGYVLGTYIINIHLYMTRTKEKEIPVSIVVSREKLGEKSIRLFFKKVTLRFKGEELTIIRFDLDAWLRQYWLPDQPRKVRL